MVASGRGGQLQSAEYRLAVPHVLQLRFLGWSHLENHIVVIYRTGIWCNARACLAVIGVGELGVFSSPGLHSHLVAVCH